MALVACGVAGTIAARALLVRALLFKFRRDVGALNAGDYEPSLANYAEDAVLRFNDGPHRWAGEHRGKPAIARFLRNFVDAGLQGHITELLIAGAPWRMTAIARFDDHAHDPAGEEIYRNRTILLVRSRWGRIVHHEDFYEDTGRILDLEAHLSERGVRPSE
jgi:ketosteroid isomerase-like protein